MNKLKIAFYAFCATTLLGIFAISYSLFSVMNYIYCYNTYEEVEGKVNGFLYDKNNTKRMIVTYEIDEETYEAQTSYTQDEADIGYTVKIKYDTKDPNNYIVGNENINLVSSAIGGAITLIGLIGVIYTFPTKAKKNIKGE